MSTPIATMNQDDDSPEEGEIQDDDEIASPEIVNCPVASTSKSKDIFASPRTRTEIDRDIREFELQRGRGVRSRVSSGDSAMGSITRRNDSFTRRKDRRPRVGLTHGKENRHVRHSQSPPSSKGRCHSSVEHRTSEQCRDSSPLRRYSSQSSIESEEKASPDPASYYGTRPKRPLKSGRSKHSSSSPDPDHISSRYKSKPHHAGKCPLMKVLHSVAKETRLIAMETAESNCSGNSLKTRLLNMGMISRSDNLSSSDTTKLNDVDSSPSIPNLCLQPSSELVDESNVNSNKIVSKHIERDMTQIYDPSDDITIIPIAKPLPEVVTLSDSDDNGGTVANIPQGRTSSPLCINNGPDSFVPQPDPRDSVRTPPLTPESSAIIIPSVTTEGSRNGSDDEDVGHLRLLALQSKKHEPTPPGDDDVLQLRLAALKTAIVKKFKERKKGKVSANVNAHNNGNPPLSPLEKIPLPASHAALNDEVTFPVDMDIADTDDEGTESDPQQGTVQEDLLQDLLPPPPPPDLPLDLFYHDQSADTAMMGACMLSTSSSEALVPPPLPHFFREMLGSLSDVSLSSTMSLPPPKFVSDIPEMNMSLNCVTTSSGSSLVDESAPSLGRKIKRSKRRSLIAPTPQVRLQSKTRPNLLVIPINGTNPSVAESQLDNSAPSENMDIDSMIVLDEVYDSSPVHDLLNSSVEEEQAKQDSRNEELFLTEQQAHEPVNQIESVNVGLSGLPPRRNSMEEEEQILRQRLLLNLANKRVNGNSTAAEENTVKDSRNSGQPDKTEQDAKKIMIDNSSNKIQSTITLEKVSLNDSCPVSSLSRLKPNNPTFQKSAAHENRFIIQLHDDSDSSGDYSEAETLGMMCVKNKEDFQRQVRDFDPNLFKSNISQMPSIKSALKAPAPAVKPRLQIDSRSRTNEKVPQFESLSELETKVDRFLKGVRSSLDSQVSTPSSTNVTPVAVRHLPASQQEEYRRLKEQIAQLEKQKTSLNKNGVLRKTSEIASKALTKINSPIKVTSKTSLISSNNALLKSSSSNSTGKLSVLSKKMLPLGTRNSSHSKFPTGTISAPLKPKTVTARAKALEIKKSCKFIKMTNVPRSTSNVTTFYPISQTKVKEKTINSIKVTVPQTSSIGSIKMPREVSVSSTNLNNAKVSNFAPQNVQNFSVRIENSTPIIPSNSSLKSVTPLELESHKTLIELEKKLISERSFVFDELSTLGRLLTQVEKSLDVQSHTASEVSNLLDQLCLAAGRWRAQNRTVTNLVAKVAQRQKELSQGHCRCVAVSKSCADLGSQLHGKLYRIPSDKAGSMRFQLKHVHEKTQVLARRRAAEQDRKNILGKRVEDCLTEMFKDTMKAVPSPSNSRSPKKLTVNDTKSTFINTAAHPCSEAEQQHENTLIHKSNTCNAPNTRSELVSKMLAYRIAQVKVRSAKVFLSWPRCKSALKKKKKGNKFRILDCKRSKEFERDGKQELSDMDISIDGEETDVKAKFQDENNEVVDMALSPDISASPDTSFSPSNTREAVQAPTSIAYCKSPNSDNHQNKTQTDLQQISDCGENVVTEEKDASLPTFQRHSKDSFDIVVKANLGSSSKQKPVLQDYISPLGGLKLSSCCDMEGKRQDPYAILCPYDLNGKCQDSDCPFKHQQ